MKNLTKNIAIDNFLFSTNNYFIELVQKIKASEEEKGNSFDSKDEEMTMLQLQYNVVRSLAKYVQSTDTFISTKINRSLNDVVYYATFERNDEPYTIETQVIYAGGYNIQKLHFRYLSKCSIKATNDNAKNEISKIKEIIKYQTKELKLQAQIKIYSDLIEKHQKHIDTYSQLTDKQIEQINYYTNDFYVRAETWKFENTRNKEIQTQEQFDQYIQTIINDGIKSFKNEHIHYKQMQIDSHKKRIKSEQQKLQKLQAGN